MLHERPALAKADLLRNMVMEFPSGARVHGGITYALH